MAMIDTVDLGPVDPELGPVTLEPTVVSGGTARNMIPAIASCFFDIRTNPGWENLPSRLGENLFGQLRVHSSRIRPCSICKDHLLVRAAQAARPSAKLFGSRGVSDLAFFSGSWGIPGIKVGPGVTERSHTPDEFVLESELLEGRAFYEALLPAWARLVNKEES
jgi:acetylornithine deacetylase